MDGRSDYGYKLPLDRLSEFALANNLLQVVNINTWKRVINGTKKESCLDHMYLNCTEKLISLDQIEPTFGDRLLVHVELNFKDVTSVNIVFKRNWKNYCPLTVNQNIKESIESSNINWNELSVQEHWNRLGNILIVILVILPFVGQPQPHHMVTTCKYS